MVLTRRDELHQSLLALLHHFHAHKNDEFRSEKYTLCLKNDSNIAHYNFKVHEPILVTFGRDVVERARYRMELFPPPHSSHVSAPPGKTRKRENRAFQMTC